MRYKAFLTSAFVFILSFHSKGQEQVIIKEYFEDQPLSLVFFHLETNYRLNIDCDPQLIKGIRTERNIRRLGVENTMKLLLEGTGLNFDVKGRDVFIYKGERVRKIGAAPVIVDPTRNDITVSGVIKEAETGETLPNAVVILKGTTYGTTTNLDGYFTLLNIPTDTSTFVIRYLGYETTELKLTPEVAAKPLLIELSNGSTQLEEVIIQAEKDEMVRVSDNISQVAISPAQIASLPSLGEKDIFRSFQLLPGVSGTNESSSGLFIRGGTPDQNLIMYDGFTVYHVDHFYGFFSAFNSNAIKDVQLYKGGFEAKYGGRISSVMEITGKTGNTNNFSMSGGISAISGNVTAEVPLFDGKGSLLVAGRRSYTDIIKSNLFNDVNDLFNEEPEVDDTGQGGPPAGFLQNQTDPTFFFYDLNTKLTYRPSDKDVVSVSLYNGQDNLDNSRTIDNNTFGGLGGRFGGGGGPFGGGGDAPEVTFLNDTDDILKWGNWGTSVKWGRQWTDRFYSNTVLAYSNYFSERNRLSLTEVTLADSLRTISNGSLEDNDLKDITLRWDGELLLTQSNQLEFGTQITRNKVVYDFIQNDTTAIVDRNDTGLTTAFYVQDKLTLWDDLTLNLGTRATHYDVTGKVYIEPRASLAYDLTDRIKLKAAWGKYNQFVTRIVREDVTTGSRDFWLVADDETNPVSKSTHYIAGVSYQNDEWLFDVEGFYKNLDGLSEFSLRFSNPIRPGRAGGTTTVDELFFEGSGVAKGIEFLAQRKVGKYTGWIGYTLSRVEYDFPELSDDPFPALHDQRHEFKVVSNFEVGQWDLAATFVYGSGKPYTAPIGTYDLTLLDGSTSNFVTVGDKNGLRLPSYQRLDLSATFNFYLGKAKSNLGLSIFNLYGHNNIWYKEFEVVEGEIIETDVNYLGFTPSVFFNFKF